MNSSEISDFPFLDIENMTPENWRALIYKRIVGQKNNFINNFKTKVINDINECMKNVLPDTTFQRMQTDIIKQINENTFEFEYQSFIDGIVSATFEYVCQFIIKNSMDNIKRTQNALKLFSVSTNNNDMRPYFNDSVKLQESKLDQIQSLDESNNNRLTVTDKITDLFISSSQSGDVSSLIRMDNENMVSTTSLCDYGSSLKHLSLPSKLPLNQSNEINITNNAPITNNLINIEEDDDFQTTQAIMSLAMNVNQQDIQFGYSDGFEDGNITNSSYVSTSNETCSSFIIKNADHGKLEEDYTNHGLKILESLVNIEHSKLEDQKTLVQDELKQSNIKSKEKEQGKLSNKMDLRNKKNPKSKQKLKKSDEEDWLPSKEQKSYYRNKKKLNEKKRKHKNKNINVENQKKLNKSSCCHLNKLVETQDNQSISLLMKDSLYSRSTKKSNTITIPKIDTNNSGVISLASKNKKGNSTNKLKTRTGNVENMLVIQTENYNTIPNTSIIDVDSAFSNTYLVSRSTNSHDEKHVHNLKVKTSHFCLPKNSVDYQKLYDNDRKRLFNPDIIISSKPMKDSTNNTCVIKENNLEQKADTVSKSKKHNSRNNKSSKEQNNSKCKINNDNNSLKRKHDTKLLSKISSKFFNQNSTSSNAIIVKHNRSKKLKVGESDVKIKTKVNINKTKESNNTKFLRNKNFNNVKINRSEVLENDKMNCMNTLKNEWLNDDIDDMSEFIKAQYKFYNIKPCYIVIDPNMRY